MITLENLDLIPDQIRDMEAQARPTDDKTEGEGLKVDMNDIFSLRRPRDCGAGLSSGLKSAAKVGFDNGLSYGSPRQILCFVTALA